MLDIAVTFQVFHYLCSPKTKDMLNQIIKALKNFKKILFVNWTTRGSSVFVFLPSF